MRKPNMQPNQTAVSKLETGKRCSTFDEVILDYTLEEAQNEAERCMNCPDKYCMQYCPAHNYIPEFIEQIREGNLLAAWNILSKTNPFMEISGRICPYEQQCESHCTRGIKCEPVAIGRLERFIADWHRKEYGLKPWKIERNGKKVAIVGAGPAGLTCAFSLTNAGFSVDIYEAENEIGGVAAWGIPEFVLPRQLIRNFEEQIDEQQIAIKYNVKLGRDINLGELTREYDAVFVATGAQVPVESSAEGTEIEGVVQAKDYLSAPENYKGKKVAIIGGGNTAIDAARVAVRNGSESVDIIYRRTEIEMPVTKLELSLAKEEGINLVTLASPSAFLSDGDSNKLAQIKLTKMEITAPDYPGGRNNVRATAETTVGEYDIAVLALGFTNPLIETLPHDDKNRIKVRRHSFYTGYKNVYAGGDAVSGPATFMKAAAAGKEAACEIFEKFYED